MVSNNISVLFCLLHTCNQVKKTRTYAMSFHSSVPLLPLPRKKSSHKWKMRRNTEFRYLLPFKFIFCLKEWLVKETIYSISLRGNNFWNKVSKSWNSSLVIEFAMDWGDISFLQILEENICRVRMSISFEGRSGIDLRKYYTPIGIESLYFYL